MLIKSRGIVFRNVKYSESSLIIDIFTEEYGLRTYIAGGVRKPKARMAASLLQIMSLVNLVGYERAGSQMNRLKEVHAAYAYQSIPFYFPKSAVGQFMIEVARKSIRERESNSRLFNFLFEQFCFLDQTRESVANFPLYFLIHLSPFLGFKPGEYDEDMPYFDMRQGVFIGEQKGDTAYLLDQDCSLALGNIQMATIESLHSISLSPKIRQLLLSKLLLYYRLHLEHFPTIRSRDILKQVLEAGQT